MYADDLARRAADGRPVTVALVGAGRFGTTVAAQVGQMRGLRLAVVCDIRPANAREALRAAGYADEQIVEAAAPGAVGDALATGRAALSTDPLVAAHSPVDVVVEVTGAPHVAALVISEALGHGRHVVNVTVEADILLGACFVHLAAANGVVYSVADGDQPGVTRRLIDWAEALGYRIVAVGRGTRFYPSDAEGQPEEAFARYGFSADLVARRRLNPQMYNSFRDGSKAQIEMTSLANMTGLAPDVRGMHQPSAGVGDLPRLFCPREHGGLLSREGVVELANAVAPDGASLLPDELTNGVFVVLGTDSPLLGEDTVLWGLPGHVGRFAALYRPYHLCGIETPLSILDAALYGRPTGAPRPVPTAECLAVAKRDLRAGEILDGSGGKTVVGQIERAGVARAGNLLPLGLAYNVPLRRDIPRGQALTYDDVRLDESAPAVRLRRQQDALTAAALAAD
ncbi:MAG: flagellar biosynthesis protein FlgA [Chloroflexota bacterium]|nr:flagellar biosynthesis protein FlgA [Chloroflexota bacterium]